MTYVEPKISEERNNEKRKRKRKIIWFNPPYSKNVKTNIGKIFFKLLHKHFPPSHSFHKIFNKKSVKISYSCMCNMSSIISGHTVPLSIHQKQVSVVTVEIEVCVRCKTNVLHQISSTRQKSPTL